MLKYKVTQIAVTGYFLRRAEDKEMLFAFLNWATPVPKMSKNVFKVV